MASRTPRVSATRTRSAADGTRKAVADNSVGGDMTAAISLMAKDRDDPKISYQVLMVSATDASVETASYREFAGGIRDHIGR
ncbi:alpha/beta hydrolase fold domain-containing protein [Sphingomonas sp. H39-1-10]|uniref:alpha/beta hydrolase fold domain-containing protein n=1 Tax=Sphingomonas pollutisoli TaxID=3030829 RepID=UPI0023B97775|nr:alpha/beta hydrolase fold domain-containing protein [Sphingomonas pollutisoli]MDF0487511.1 alpha/beta hydrolase fold domain-containing protein [Sphingomonas pollutisoli]